MKRNTLMKALLALLLLLATAFAVATVASAEAAESSLSIEYANVAYQAKTRLAFTLKGTVAEGDTAGIAVWENGFTGERTAENASYFSFEADTLDDKVFYLTDGIAADDMSYRITVAPCVKNAEGKVTLAGDSIEYSIYDYVIDRLDDEGVTEAQMRLYSNLVYYGNCAEKVIDGGVQLPLIITKGGYVDETATMHIGNTATVNARPIKGGKYFLYWVTPSGEKVYDRVFKTTARGGNNVYTAVYGSASESAYAGAIDFDKLPLGPLNLLPSGLTTPTYDAKFGHYFQYSLTFLGGVVELDYARTLVTSETDLTPVKATVFDVLENEVGRYIAFDKNGIGGTQYALFRNNSGVTADRVEVEMAYTKRLQNETTALYFNLGGSFRRIDVRYEANGDLYLFKNGTSVKVYCGNIPVGERFNVAAEVDENGLVVIYVNGVKATTDKNGNHLLDGFDFGLTAGSNYTATQFRHESYSYDTNAAVIYAVNFVDTDLFGN